MINENNNTAAKFWKSIGVNLERGNRDDSKKLKYVLCLLSARLIYDRHPHFDDAHYDFLPEYVKGAADVLRSDEKTLTENINNFVHRIGSRFKSLRLRALDSDNLPESEIFHFKNVIDTISSDSIPYVFEYGILRALDVENVVSSRHVNSVIELAAPLAYFFHKIIDVTATTGEVLFRTTKYSPNDMDNKSLTVLGSDNDADFYLFLRLSTFDFICERNTYNRHRPYGNEFILIDPPAQISSRANYFDSNTEPKSALEFLLSLTYENSHDLAITILPVADCTQRGWRQSYREELVERGRVVAAIDFKTLGKSGQRKTMTALLTSDSPRNNRENILFIDATALNGLSKNNGFSSMAFAAEIVKIWAGFEWIHSYPSNAPSYEDENQKLTFNVFDREFRDGYKDIPGLCRSIDKNEVAQKDFTFIAKRYTGAIDERNRMLELINSDPVVDLIFENENLAKCIYVIGNNGEGKSLLLNDLAKRLPTLDRHAIGIAFGTTDRFPFASKKHLGANGFTYAGARTSTTGISTKTSALALTKYINSIFTDQARLDVFHNILETLGFVGNHYLVQAQKTSALEEDPSVLLSLSSDASKNAEVLSHAAIGYTLGLKREHFENYIVPFNELSSGEQQMLSLVIKILALAELHSIFLIDEPEISLHVSWQRAIPFILHKLSTDFGCHFIVATHSPILIASSIYENDICFVAKNQALLRLSEQSRKTVEGVLYDGFKTHTPYNRKIPEQCAALVARSIDQANTGAGAYVDIDSAFAELNQMSELIQKSKISYNSRTTDTEIALIAAARAAINELSRLTNEQKPND